MNPGDFKPAIIELLAAHEGLARMGFDADAILVDVDGPLPKVILVEMKRGKRLTCEITIEKPLDMGPMEFRARWGIACRYFNDVWRDGTRDRIWQQSMFRRNLDTLVGAIGRSGIKVPMADELLAEENK